MKFSFFAHKNNFDILNSVDITYIDADHPNYEYFIKLFYSNSEYYLAMNDEEVKANYIDSFFII